MTQRRPSRRSKVTMPLGGVPAGDDTIGGAHGERIARLETEFTSMWREMERMAEILNRVSEGIQELPTISTRVQELSTNMDTLNKSVGKFNSWLDKGLGAKGLLVLLFTLVIGASSLAGAWKTLHEWWKGLT